MLPFNRRSHGCYVQRAPAVAGKRQHEAVSTRFARMPPVTHSTNSHITVSQALLYGTSTANSPLLVRYQHGNRVGGRFSPSCTAHAQQREVISLPPSRWAKSPGLGSDLRYLLRSDAPLTRLEPKPLFGVTVKQEVTLCPVTPSFCSHHQSSNTGKTGKWKSCYSSTHTSSGRCVPPWPSPHQAPAGRASQVPVCCLLALFFFLPFLSFVQQGCGKNRFAPHFHISS